MDWTALINVAVAAIAVGISFLAVMRSNQQQQRDAFFRSQEMLMASDLQQGRRLLGRATRAGELPANDEDYELVERALSNFNTVATLVRLRVVPRRWILESWHHALRDMRIGYESVSAERRTRMGVSVDHRWLDLGALITAAERYRSNGPCCRSSTHHNEPSEIRTLKRADALGARRCQLQDLGRRSPIPDTTA